MNRHDRLDALRRKLAELRSDIAVELEAEAIDEADARALQSWGVLPADIVRILGRPKDDEQQCA